MEKEVPVPNNWYVNSIPGGTFLDVSIEVEVAAKMLHKMPTTGVLAVGTNDAGRHMVMECAERHFRLLLLSVAAHFPMAKVSCYMLVVFCF